MTEVVTRRQWKCDNCQKVDVWGPTWSQFFDMKVEDCAPQDLPTVCSDQCKNEFDSKLESGECALPKVRLKGYNFVVTKKRKGY